MWINVQKDWKNKVMNYEESFLDIVQIRTLVRQGNVVWRDHAMKRLRDRKITRDDVRNAIYNGEIIEDRPDDICPGPVFQIRKILRILHRIGF